MTDGFLGKIKDALSGNNESENPDQGQFGNVRPASEDPYGDPADQENQQQFGNIRPASKDPYGDPADQENQG
jgi:hypothetical protein